MPDELSCSFPARPDKARASSMRLKSTRNARRASPARLMMVNSVLPLAVMLAGCGDGDGGSGMVSAPLAVTPTPAPTPAPPPPPPPPPVPSTPGPLPAGGSVGNELEGLGYCIRSKLTFNPRGSASPGLAAVSYISGPEVVEGAFPGPRFAIGLLGPDTYTFGYDEPALGPADEIVPETAFYDQFFAASYEGEVELSILRNSASVHFDWATLGLFANTDSACPFAIGLPLSSPLTNGAATYSGVADGIALVGGETRRLFGSKASFTFDYATGNGTVRLELEGRDNAFGNFTLAAPSPIVTVSGTFAGTFAGTSAGTGALFSGSLSGPGGMTGSVTGRLLGPQGKGAGLAFVLTDASGFRIVGAAALAPN